MNLGENLINYRKENGLTQEGLAEQLNVSRQSIYKWESGQSYPEVQKLLLISQLLNCNLDELVKGEVNSNIGDNIPDHKNVENQNVESDSGKKKSQRQLLIKKITSIIMLVAIMSNFVLGIIWDLWHLSWLAIPVGAMLCGIVNIIYNDK